MGESLRKFDTSSVRRGKEVKEVEDVKEVKERTGGVKLWLRPNRGLGGVAANGFNTEFAEDTEEGTGHGTVPIWPSLLLWIKKNRPQVKFTQILQPALFTAMRQGSGS